MKPFELLDRLCSGEKTAAERAWNDFLEQYSKLFLKVIWLKEHDYDEAMEKYLFVCRKLSENNFSILRKYRKDYNKNPPKFTSWLAAVVSNLAIDAHRKKYGRKRFPKLLQSMKEADQKFFKLYYWEGYSLEEIDHQLSSSASQQESSAYQIHRDIKAIFLDSNQKKPTQSRPVKFQQYKDVVGYQHAGPNGGITKDLTEFLKYWLQKLPTKRRLVLKMRFWDDLKPLEIAEILHIEPPNTVYRILKKSLAELRENCLQKLS